MYTRHLHWFGRAITLLGVAATVQAAAAAAPFSLTETVLTIPQVDYEPAVHYREGDPYPHLDRARVNRDTVVHRRHPAVILENEHIRLSVLPAMGRVYSMVYKPTGHEELWRNDIVNVGGGRNDTGWWIWIGGVEYDLPGDEHGTTWAETWEWRTVEDSPSRKAVRMRVRERGTGLLQTVEVSIYPGKAYYEARVEVFNPTDRTVEYAQWTNPQWTPGGHNELTDNTEFIIPTDHILIEEHWRRQLGPSPQDWAGNPLRFVRGRGMGGMIADGLKAGFYSAYSHDEEEGMVRVFDPAKTPGAKVWTYGYHPDSIPMGSGAPSKGYVEMWGGTAKVYAVDTHPLGPGESVHWWDWMYPYQRTGGLTYADRDLAVNFKVDSDAAEAVVGICPSGRWRGEAGVWLARSADDQATERTQPLRRWDLRLSPREPFCERMQLPKQALDDPGSLVAGIRAAGREKWQVLKTELARGPVH